MSEALLVINPKLEECAERYIWGIEKESFLIFAELASHEIQVDGFIGKEEEVGMYLFHRPVISQEMLSDKDNVLILSKKSVHSDLNVLTDIFRFHNDLKAEKVIVYGAGHVGEGLAAMLSARGISIECFLDRNKSGQKLSGIPIYHPQILHDMNEPKTIILAGIYRKEMEETVKRENPRAQMFYVEELPFERMGIRLDAKNLYQLSRLWLLETCMPDCFPDRKIVFLGNDIALARRYRDVLRYMGYQNVSFMVTDDSVACEEAPLVDEILYEENYLIMLYEKNGSQEIISKIEELSIADAAWTSVVLPQPLGHKEFLLDLNLGNIYQTNYKPGLYRHGRGNISDIKIVTLGGSTTDEEVYLIPSWPKILFEKYCGDGGITLYNGGTDAHASFQELIRLVRDVIWLQPDIILVYDGFNDCYEMGFEYIYNLFAYAKEEVYANGVMHQKVGDGVFGGIAPEDSIEKWLKNIESMYAIARAQNIEFFSFIQPMALSQEIHTKQGRAIRHMSHIFIDSRKAENMLLLRKRGRELQETHSYIYDLSDIFDGQDVYMDYCHVWEHGNAIVADSIWKVIEPTVERLKRQKSESVQAF